MKLEEYSDVTTHYYDDGVTLRGFTRAGKIMERHSLFLGWTCSIMSNYSEWNRNGKVEEIVLKGVTYTTARKWFLSDARYLA